VEWGRRNAGRVGACAHGYSGNARDFDDLARGGFLADIHGLLARLGVDRVDWVGTSMGGLLGMLLAASPREIGCGHAPGLMTDEQIAVVARFLDAGTAEARMERECPTPSLRFPFSRPAS
jgi:pimeloyl-ACP methyl ester carboxylesterase